MKKCLKRIKNTKNHKHTKNHNHITYCSSDRVRTSFLPILGHFCSFTPFLAQKIKIFEKLKKKKKTLRDIIILHTLRCLIQMLGSEIFLKFNKKWVKINVGVRIFQRNINHSFIIIWCKRTTSDKKEKAFLFFKIAHVTKMSHNGLFLN